MINILIPMCGQGSRMKDYSQSPKPLALIEGIPLLGHTLRSLNLKGHYIFVKPTYSPQEEISFFNILKENSINFFTIINHDSKTEGASESALVAKQIINNKMPLIITNCDQSLIWDSERFINKIKKDNCDSIIVTFKSNDTQHSYAKISQKGNVTEIKEKEIISNDALVGIHYWRHGKDFVRDAEEIIKNNIRFKNEFYISTAISSLISRKKIIHLYPLENELFFPLGTIEDIIIFSKREKKDWHHENI